MMFLFWMEEINIVAFLSDWQAPVHSAIFTSTTVLYFYGRSYVTNKAVGQILFGFVAIATSVEIFTLASPCCLVHSHMAHIVLLNKTQI